MTKAQTPFLLCIILLTGILAAGCKDDAPAVTAPPLVAADAVPDFSLTDVNPTSATSDQQVSPRDHLQHVSAWYFGHST